MYSRISSVLIFLVFLLAGQQGLGQKIEIERLTDTVNTSDYDEISPVVTWDGTMLFFTRVGYPDFNKSLIIEKEDIAKTHPDQYESYLRDVYSKIAGRRIQNPVASGFNQDIWIAGLNGDTISYLDHPGPPLNNALPNSVSSLTPDMNSFIVINQFYPDGGMSKGFSKVSRLNDSTWSFPVPIFIEDYYTKGEGVSLTMSADGNILILSLERKDSHGNNDLYVSFKKEDGTFTRPKNLGRQVNSIHRETTPSISADNRVIYFSSNRRGNNDIYFVRRIGEDWDNWSVARRFIEPINSQYDDSQPFFNTATGYLYFTSRRRGSSDIYRAKIASPQKVEVTIEGIVRDTKTGSVIPAKVYAGPAKEENYLFVFDAQDGRFKFKFDSGKDIKLKAFKPGYISRAAIVPASESYYRTEYELTLYVDSMETKKTISLNPIFFEKSKPNILEVSYGELNHLASILEENPGISIRIEGHTDNLGPKPALLKLSEDRAKAVKSFLINKGIDAHRISTRGHGDTQPLNDNTTEAERAENRRVEIIITEIKEADQPKG